MAGDATARLVAAFAQFKGLGKPPTVRSLKEAANVSTDAAREFLARLKSADTVPAPPDLTAAFEIVWAAAWTKAAEAADEAVRADLAAARAAEADALDRAATAEAAQAEAEAAADDLRRQVAELGEKVVDARKAAAVAEDRATVAESGQAKAEADALRATTTVEVLQQVVRDLRPVQQQPEQATEQQT